MKFHILPLLLLFFTGCANGLFYHPDRAIRETPDRRGLQMEEVRFPSTDGVMLSGWWLPSPAEEPKGTVIHFHGNAQNMSTHVHFAEWLPEEGYNLFVFDYRGYGRSEGSPNRAGLVRDGIAALQFVSERPEVDSDSLFVWAQSLGGTVALQSLPRAGVDVRALLLDSTYYSHASIAADKMRVLPWFLQWLRLTRPLWVSSGLDAHQGLRQLEDLPVAFLHGERDPVIPHHHSRRLHKAAPNPRHLWIISGAGHCDAVLRFPGQVRPLILDFFEKP